MKADNTAHLVAAAARRRQATLRRAGDAIDQLLAAGAPVSIASVSHAARVSRSWLYAETPIRDRIHAASNDHAAATTPVPQRASDASLRRRLELAHHRNANSPTKSGNSGTNSRGHTASSAPGEPNRAMRDGPSADGRHEVCVIDRRTVLGAASRA